jgi:glycosyltransferase involved in cell wall biosynthesis
MIRVSFVVIAYNEARSIARTLQAIMAQHDLPEYELVVVNDGSIDGTLAIVQKVAAGNPRVRIVDLQPNRGRGGARVAGVAAARGKQIAFVDADIILPQDWYTRAAACLAMHDACAGTAVPDGDVAFVHRVFNLTPKVVGQSTAITGSNCLFKRSVFDAVSYDSAKRNGEDVALGFALEAAGFKTARIPGLVVEHREMKSYRESLRWLFESGIGATRQFFKRPQLRMPDLAFFGFGLLVLVGIGYCLAGGYWLWPTVGIVGYVLASSLSHVHQKFVLHRTPFAAVAAVLTNGTLLLAYYAGRAVGLGTQWRRR